MHEAHTIGLYNKSFFLFTNLSVTVKKTVQIMSFERMRLKYIINCNNMYQLTENKSNNTNL